jgi:hypothetical protein
MAEVKAARYVNLVPAKKTVIGSKVTNQQSEDLGKIEDLSLTWRVVESLMRCCLLEDS